MSPGKPSLIWRALLNLTTLPVLTPAGILTSIFFPLPLFLMLFLLDSFLILFLRKFVYSNRGIGKNLDDQLAISLIVSQGIR